MVSKKDEEKLERRIQKLQEDTSFDWARNPTVIPTVSLALRTPDRKVNK